MSLKDRIYGCLAGLALGDALGMPTEMLTPEEIKAEFLIYGIGSIQEDKALKAIISQKLFRYYL